MDIIIDTLKNYDIIIILALVIAVIILIFLQILNRVQINQLEKKYHRMMKGTSAKNIEEMIIEYNENVEIVHEASKKMEQLYGEVKENLEDCIQKFSVVRYRAFDDVGSDLSFSIALLNDKNDGFVITGIYGRNECTTFAKPLENGISKYDLSDEEKTAIKNAIGR
jgi:signal transduction histidine kinase